MAVKCVDLLNLPEITQARIRKWAERGHVRTYGLDQYGMQKYELTDIIRMVSANAEAPTPAA